MSDLILAGGTVVTAESSFKADVAIAGETIAAVGQDLPRDGAEVVDVSGARLMPGFIDGHTHMDMPFGGTVTADDWDTGTAAAVAGGTTCLVDFSLQDVEGTLAGAVETWQGKAEGKAHIDYGLHVAITNLTDDVKQEIRSLPELGVATVKIFMAYKGTPLYTADEDLFEALQIAREAGVLVLVHAENGDVIAKLQAQALARGDTEPRFHATTRPEACEAEATNRAIRLAEMADAALLGGARLLRRRRSRRSGARTRAGARCTPRPARSTSCSASTTSPAPTSTARSTSARRRCATRPTRRSCGTAAHRRPADRRLGPLLVQLRRPEGARRGRLHEDPQRRARRRGAGGGAVDARRRAGPHHARTASSPCWRRTRPTCTGWRRARACSRPAPTRTSWCGTPTRRSTVTQANRHGNVDYTPYEGHGARRARRRPSTCAARSPTTTARWSAEPGSGRFVPRSFRQPAPGRAVG